MPRTQPYKPGATEEQVTAQVLDAARMFGVELRRQDCALGSNASGKRRVFGNPSDPDWTATVPTGPNRGRRLDLELKREGFRPEKARGKERDRFHRQLARMKELNAAGGLALWVDSGPAFVRFARQLYTPDLRIEFDAQGYPVVTDEQEET